VNNQIGTGEILLVDYLPPREVLTEWALAAVIAIVIVQMWKNSRRGRPYLSRFQMGVTSAGVACALIFAMLYLAHELPIRKSAAYALQGGLLTPFTATVMLWLLGRFAPGLRQKLSQDRRRRNADGPMGVERRDDTTRFI